MKKNFLIFLAVIAVALSGIAGCGDTGNSNPGKQRVEAVKVTFASQDSGPITAGSSAQLTATAVLSDGTTIDVTSKATWTSSDPSVATVSAAGLITAVGPGTTTITCTYGGVTNTLVVTIAAPVKLQSISISPAGSSAAIGTTKQFVAQGTYADGSVRNITSTVAWTSSVPSVATIIPTGVATAVSAGTTSIGASLNGVTASAHFHRLFRHCRIDLRHAVEPITRRRFDNSISRCRHV